MSRTIVQQARDAGTLIFWVDTRFGNYSDQSGNGYAVTIPSGGRITMGGLRTGGNAFSVSSLDMGTDNFWLFAYLDNLQFSAGDKMIAELGSDAATSNTAWKVYLSGTTGIVGYHRIGDAASSCTLAAPNNGKMICSYQFDRRHGSLSVIGFRWGIYDVTTTASASVPDGANYDVDTLNIMAKADNTLPLDCSMPVFGLGKGYLTHTQHATLCAEVLERKTC